MRSHLFAQRRIFVSIVLTLAGSPPAWAMCSSRLQPPKAHLHADLDHYIRGMEKSSLQKAAAGGLVIPGRIADLGSGSGISARDLAVLFPGSEVIGVDLDPAMTDYAKGHYQRPNLRFITGDVRERNFPDESLSAAFMCSTTHHLPSYCEGEFDVRHVHAAIQATHSQLRPGGLFVLRDFLNPAGPQEVLLELPVNDGASTGEPKALSTAKLFERYAADFRSSVHPRSGVPYEKVAGAPAGWQRYRLSLRDAAEFLLRKDYRESYAAEIREEYLFMNQYEYESAFRDARFRVLHSAPIYNEWIIGNRWSGKVQLLDNRGRALPWIPTNYMIIGERVTAREGLRFSARGDRATKSPSFLEPLAMRHVQSGRVYDIVHRPNETVDLLPYFERDGEFYVLGKQTFPRPLHTLADTSLNGVRTDGYVVEPLNFIRQPGLSLDLAIATELRRRSAITPSDLERIQPGPPHRFYLSPGLVTESTTSIALKIPSQELGVTRPQSDYSGFSTSGIVRPFGAAQLLRSAQVGAVLDARLEIAVYNLLLAQGAPLGPWIGKEIALANTPAPAAGPAIAPAADVLARVNGAPTFARAHESEFGGFLEVRSAKFQETNGEGTVIASAEREYIVPKSHGLGVLSALPVYRSGDKIFVGLERRDLPGVQLREGASTLITNPAWRLPKAIRSLDEAHEFVKQRFSEDFGLRVRASHNLGGAYMPTPGITPETLYPALFEVEPPAGSSDLLWVELTDLLKNRAAIKDGHLLLLTLRASHAFQRQN